MLLYLLNCTEYCEATETQTVTDASATGSSQDASDQQQQQQQQSVIADYVSLSIDAEAGQNVYV